MMVKKLDKKQTASDNIIPQKGEKPKAQNTKPAKRNASRRKTSARKANRIVKKDY